MGLFSSKYKPILDGRYVMPLVPVLLVGIGQVLARVADWVGALVGWLGASPAFGVAVLRRAAKIRPASADNTPMMMKMVKVSRSVLMPESAAALTLPPIA